MERFAASLAPLPECGRKMCAKKYRKREADVCQIRLSLIPWCQARGSLEAIGPETGPEQRQAGSAGCSFGS